jgi:hypothetical protein
MIRDLPLPNGRNYYVDEAGDPILFDRKGNVIIGCPGCSRFFMLGLLDVPDPAELTHNLEDLRACLLADPYFRGVPSMQPAAKKTALAFHATDDLPEVRREVLALLASADLRFFAVVKRKQSVLQYVLSRNRLSPDYRYHPNELYDYMVRRLFKQRLHKDSAYNVWFATRGASDRNEALRVALVAARTRFAQDTGIAATAPLAVLPCLSRTCACLQAGDYFLWALQRFYERQEDRFLNLLWPRVSLVMDVDDTRENDYGVYYTQKKPLSLAALKGAPGI